MGKNQKLETLSVILKLYVAKDQYATPVIYVIFHINYMLI